VRTLFNCCPATVPLRAPSAHKGVGMVTFTGSVETGKIVYRTAAEKSSRDPRARRHGPM